MKTTGLKTEKNASTSEGQPKMPKNCDPIAFVKTLLRDKNQLNENALLFN